MDSVGYSGCFNHTMCCLFLCHQGDVRILTDFLESVSKVGNRDADAANFLLLVMV